MSQHILVVDDEADIEALFRQQFRRDLKAGRFRMEFATSAQQALRIIEGADGRDIVLLLSDVNMPGMSGLDLLPRAKAVRPDLAVIMVTAYGDLETRRRAAEGGAEGLLPKPIDFAALRAEVDRCLEQWRGGP
jgi:DNA-binding NtrC family response regulator